MACKVRSCCRSAHHECNPRQDPEIKLKHHLKKVLAFLEPKDVLPSCAGVNRQWHRCCKDEALVSVLFLRLFPTLASNVRLEDIRLFSDIWDPDADLPIPCLNVLTSILDIPIPIGDALIRAFAIVRI